MLPLQTSWNLCKNSKGWPELCLLCVFSSSLGWDLRDDPRMSWGGTWCVGEGHSQQWHWAQSTGEKQGFQQLLSSAESKRLAPPPPYDVAAQGRQPRCVECVTLPCVGTKSAGFKHGAQRWHERRIASMERLRSFANCSTLNIKWCFYIWYIFYIYLFIKIYFSTETAAVCDRSKSFHGWFRFFISFVCYIVEMSLSIYTYICMYGFFNLDTSIYRMLISCLAGIATSQACSSPLWSLQIENTAPFSFQPDLVCRIPLESPGRGLWLSACSSAAEQGVMLQLLGTEASHRQQNCTLLVWALLLQVW